MSSELKLSLENFQSISSGEMVFHKGLNFIIGQSNSGKSATFRAVKACLLNPAGKRSQKYIKKGSKQAKVTLEYNGNQIVWTRSAKESEYTINGEKFLKTGRSSAFQIMDGNTGFVKDNSGVLRNIEEELQLPFPFDINGIELFKLYENVFCISDSSVILKSAKEQEDSVKKEISMTELELNKNQVKLDELQKFKEELDLEGLKSMKASLTSLRDSVANLKDGLDVIRRAVALDKIFLEVNPYSGEDLTVSLKELNSIKTIATQVKKAHALSKSLQELSFEPKSRLQEYTEMLSIKGVRDQLESLEGLSVPITCFDSKLPAIQEAKEISRELSRLKKLKDLKVPEESFINKLSALNELKQYKNDVESLYTSIESKQAQLRVEQEKIKELEERMATFDVCPLCHSSLKKEGTTC